MQNYYIILLLLAVVLIIIYRKYYGQDSDINTVYKKAIDSFKADIDSGKIVAPEGNKKDLQYITYYSRLEATILAQNNVFKEQAISLWKLAEESDRPLLVMVMGEFKTGKSTFINTILKDDLLKTDSVPATAVVTLLRYGDEKKVLLHELSGEVKPYPFEKIDSITAEGDASKEQLRRSLDYVELFYPNEMLKRINIIDTPGLNVHKDSHVKSTTNFQSAADVVLWVFNAARSVTRTEIAEIEALGQRLKPFAIVNRIDNIDEEEETVDEVLDNIKKRLGGFVQAVIGVSAKQAKEALADNDEKKLACSRWAEFTSILGSHFVEKSEDIKLTSIKEKLEDFGKAFQQSINEQNQRVLDMAQFFNDEQESKQRLLRGISDLENAIHYSMNTRKDLETINDNHTQIVEQGAFKVSDNTLKRNVEDMLGFVSRYDSMFEFMKNHNHKAISGTLENLMLLKDSIYSQKENFSLWQYRLKELNQEHRDLLKEKYNLDRLHKEYMHSGVFGGEPIFDFSGRRERLNNTVDVYNSHYESYNSNLLTVWEEYKSLANHIQDINNDVRKVAIKLEKIMGSIINDMKQTQRKMAENYEAEKEKYNTLIALIAEGEKSLDRINKLSKGE